MADSTVNYGWPYPEGTDNVVVHTDIKKLATNVDASLFQTNLRVDTAIPYRGFLDEQTGNLSTLAQGRYLVRYVDTAQAWGLPQRLIGMLEVVEAGNQKRITFTPNDAAYGNTVTAEWTLSTDSVGVLRDRWQRSEKAVMSTAPVVLTAPAGEYPQSNSRGAVRLPFTVPVSVSKVRVHMRPWNYRTGKTWGPATLNGVMIAQQSSPGSGTITGGRWYAPNTAGATISGTEGWTSEWFNVGMGGDSTYLLSYSVDWQDTTRDLVLGTCWSNFDTAKWDSTEDAIFQNGWGGFELQPMDVWIECEAPATVPVWGYFGASNTMGMDSGNAVFGAYPTLHARKNGAFCALTAAGGWSIMDATAHSTSLMRRFGFPARNLDRAYLDWGSNIAARGATAVEAQAELERWMNQQLAGLDNPDVYLLTQVAAPGITETTDTSGTLSDWNQWIRYTLADRPEVKGISDIASVTADPQKPWTARVELRASPSNVHFNAWGQVVRARALDGEVAFPVTAARNQSEMPGGGPIDITYLGDGVYEIN